MIPLQEFERLMKPIYDFRLESKNAENGLKLLCGSYTDFDVGGRLLDAYMRLVQEKMNDTNDWITTFVFDYEYGADPYKVKYKVKGKEKSILLKDVKSLYTILKEGSEE